MSRDILSTMHLVCSPLSLPGGMDSVLADQVRIIPGPEEGRVKIRQQAAGFLRRIPDGLHIAGVPAADVLHVAQIP